MLMVREILQTVVSQTVPVILICLTTTNNVFFDFFFLQGFRFIAELFFHMQIGMCHTYPCSFIPSPFRTVHVTFVYMLRNIDYSYSSSNIMKKTYYVCFILIKLRYETGYIPCRNSDIFRMFYPWPRIHFTCYR